jgi:hypothetical protein
MGAADRADPLPLPPGWPRRLRSAVVHAIGMARAALATSRGRAGVTPRREPSTVRRNATAPLAELLHHVTSIVVLRHP